MLPICQFCFRRLESCDEYQVTLWRYNAYHNAIAMHNQNTKYPILIFNAYSLDEGFPNLLSHKFLQSAIEVYRTTSPVRYPAGFQENVLSGIRPDFLQCPVGYYLKTIIFNNRNL